MHTEDWVRVGQGLCIADTICGFPLAREKWAVPTPRLQSEAASVYLLCRTKAGSVCPGTDRLPSPAVMHKHSRQQTEPRETR